MKEMYLADQRTVKRELEKIGMGEIAKSGIFSYLEYFDGNSAYFVPHIQVAEFENHLSKGSYSLPSDSHPRRHGIYISGAAIIKTAKKDILHLILDSPELAELHLKRRLRRDRLAAEIINAFNYHEVGLPVVKPICLIESLRIEHLKNGGEFYLIEKLFSPIPNVEGELEPRLFGNDNLYKKTIYALEIFRERISEKGYEYVPAEENRPYADLVFREKKDGDFEILATDWPFFRRLDKI